MRVIMFDIDTLRADHMGCYGYGRDTTPVMDSVAEEGVCFDRYYCPNAPCLPSRASLISGQYGIHNGIVGHGGTAADMRLQGESRGFTFIRCPFPPLRSAIRPGGSTPAFMNASMWGTGEGNPRKW